MVKEQSPTNTKASATSVDTDWVRPPVEMCLLGPVELTRDFSEAILQASKLPVEDQNYLAWRIGQEMAEEKKWTDSFAASEEYLLEMAEEARAQHARGETQSLEEFLAEQN